MVIPFLNHEHHFGSWGETPPRPESRSLHVDAQVRLFPESVAALEVFRPTTGLLTVTKKFHPFGQFELEWEYAGAFRQRPDFQLDQMLLLVNRWFLDRGLLELHFTAPGWPALVSAGLAREATPGARDVRFRLAGVQGLLGLDVARLFSDARPTPPPRPRRFVPDPR